MPAPKFSGPKGMRLFRSQLESPDLRSFIKAIEQSSDQTVQDILEFVRLDVVRYLKAYTDKFAPPDFRVSYFGGDPKAPRPRHPGGWADISGELKKGYHAEVYKPEGGGWALRLWNDAIDDNVQSLAAVIEAKYGYFVVSGVMDPGGPVDWSIRRAVRRLAPTWQVHGLANNVISVDPLPEGV